MGICAILFPNLLLNLFTNQENAANIESATYDVILYSCLW